MNQKIEALGVEYLRRLIQSERQRLAALDDEISKLHSLEEVRRQCAGMLHEYEVMLTDYQNIDEAYVSDWFYTVPRHETELPMDTRVEVIANNMQHHHNEGRKGKVVGYRCCPGAIWPYGWHYIRFYDDLNIYPDRIAMPYVHRIYLEMIP